LGSFTLVLKLGILILLIKHLLKTSEVLKTTVYYAGIFFTLGVLFSLGTFSPLLLVFLIAIFLYDMATGYIFFWLLERFQNNYFLFYLIIFGGIAFSIAMKVLALTMNQ